MKSAAWQKMMSKCGEPISTSMADRGYKLLGDELSPDNLFGQVDAVMEWGDDTNRSSKLFVHTQSYETLTKRDTLFLFGRRGTGKTALIKMLDYEIKQKAFKKIYDYSSIVYQEKTFYEMTLALREVNEYCSRLELVRVISDIFIWAIYVTAMSAINEKTGKLTNPNLEAIRNYLTSEGLVKTTSQLVINRPIKRAVKIFTQCINSVSDNRYTRALNEAREQLESESYLSALNSLVSFLTERKEHCLVLFDSQELYEFDDPISEHVISGLLDAVNTVYNQNNLYRVYSKAAFPSEMVPHLAPLNLGKLSPRRHFIFWRYKDLIQFISKRYCQLLKEEAASDSPDCEKIHASRKYVYKFVPAKTESFSSISFDTLAYIINHTQKKPREVIMLFNAILTLAKQNSIPLNSLNPDCIREGTNARVEDLSGSVIDMYRNIFKNADWLIKKPFIDSENIFIYGDLQRKLTEARSLFDIPQLKSLERHAIESLFTESGLIGVVEEIHELENGKFICQANFEYQIKDVITLQSHDVLAIHPMFYQELHIRAYSNVLVVPKPTASEWDEMNAEID